MDGKTLSDGKLAPETRAGKQGERVGLDSSEDFGDG